MRKRIILMIMAVLLIVFGGLYFANNKQFKGYPIKIGATYPESGNFAIYGESLRNGSILAVEEVNRNGGINGRPFEIIYFDNQGDLTLAISSVNRFINIDKVPIILNSFEFLSLATKNIVEKNKTVMIMSTTYKLTKDDYSSYVFRDYWDFGLIGESFSLAANKIGSNKIGIIAQSDASFNSFKSSFVSNLSGKIVIEERFQYGTKDFKTQLSKLNNSDMDTIVVFAFPVEASIILKQMHDLGMNKYKLIITEASESFVKESNKQFLEKVNAITYLGSELPEKQKEFIEKYQKRFDWQIPRADAMYIYEDVLLLADALKDCEKNSNVTGSCIASKIGNEFDQYHNKSRNLPIVQFKNGLKPFDL